LQLAGWNVVVVADDGRLLSELSGTGDARGIKRRLVGDDGVTVEEAENRWLASNGVIEEGAANASFGEDFVVQAPAMDPGARADTIALGAEPGADIVNADGVEEIGALGV